PRKSRRLDGGPSLSVHRELQGREPGWRYDGRRQGMERCVSKGPRKQLSKHRRLFGRRGRDEDGALEGGASGEAVLILDGRSTLRRAPVPVVLFASRRHRKSTTAHPENSSADAVDIVLKLLNREFAFADHALDDVA